MIRQLIQALYDWIKRRRNMALYYQQMAKDAEQKKQEKKRWREQ